MKPQRTRKTSLLLPAWSALLVTACGPALSPAAGPATREDPAARTAAFANVEDEALRELAATDRRVAVRARIQTRDEDLRRVTMGALLAEDPTLAAVDGAIDPFSFEARGRGIAAVKAKLALVAPSLAAEGNLENELLARLVDEEAVRLEEERALPRSASALIRGIVETWVAVATPQEAAERDRWLSRRLAELSVTVEKPGALDVVRARELDDALDALEHDIEASGLGHATQELVKLREELEAQATRPAAAAASTWPDVARGMKAHLGFALAPEMLDTRLAETEKALRSAAETALAAAASRIHGDDLGAHAAPLVFASATTPCAVAIAASRVRSMAPPPERLSACRLRDAALAAKDDASRAYVLVALHDHVVVAQWALDVARGVATVAVATGKHRPLSRPPPDVIARWERIAIAQPTVAIGGGLAADILFERADEVEARARKWSELGEVPLDVAERELQLRSTP